MLLTNVSAITATTAQSSIRERDDRHHAHHAGPREVERDHELAAVVLVGDRPAERLEQDVGQEPDDRGGARPMQPNRSHRGCR